MAPATKTKTKTKTTKTTTIHVGVLLDESGSMEPNRQAVIDGTNEFIGSLQGEKNSERTKLTLAMFDERPRAPRTRVKIDGEDLNEVGKLGPDDYAPQGMTPLNDAIADTIAAIEERQESGDKAMLVIYTDGYENASREFDKAAIKAMVERKEKDGWTVIYLGANVDAQAEGGAIGATVASGFTSTPMGTRSAMRRSGAVGQTYLASGGALSAEAMQKAYGSEIPEGSDPAPRPLSRGRKPEGPSPSDTARDMLRDG